MIENFSNIGIQYLTDNKKLWTKIRLNFSNKKEIHKIILDDREIISDR